MMKNILRIGLSVYVMIFIAYAQTPLTNSPSAVGVLGTNNFVTNTNYTPPSINTFAEPIGVAVDPTTGKLFVADRDNRRVLRFSSTAKYKNGSDAEAVFGQRDFLTRTANNGGISDSTMNNPNGLFVDNQGTLWVADRDNNRVLRFDNASTKLSSSPADGVLGQPDFTTNSTGTTSAKMNAPASVYVDKEGRLWVADRANNRVLRFDSASVKSNGASANGVLGEPDFVTATGGTTASTMKAPWGVCADKWGSVWVADRSNSRVLRYDSAATKANGGAADGVLGQLNLTSSTAAKTQSGFTEPRGVAIDPLGRLFVSDEGNTRIMVYNNAAKKDTAVPADIVIGQTDFISDSSANPPTASSLSYPISVFIDYNTNDVWVPDAYNHRVLRFVIGPPMAAGVLGANDLSTNTNYASPSTTTFAEPVSVAIDPVTGKLFVADRDNRRVLRFASADKMVNGSAAEAVFGQPDFVTRSANTGGISASTMNNPNAVSVDLYGHLWVADRDNNRILRFNNASSKASSSAADGVLGQPDFTTNTTGAAGGKMNAPACVYADAYGRVWVADRANNRVLRFDNAASKSNGAGPNSVLGQSDYSSTSGGTTATTMSAPWGVFYDGNGRLWVADRGNSRVLRFDNAASKSNGSSADGVLGQADFTSSAFSTTRSGFGEPRGVCVDASGRLYVADEGNTRVMVFENAALKSNGADADNVYGQVNFTSDNAPSPPTANSLNYPLSLFVDNANSDIWLPDPYNHRVLRFNGPTINLSAPSSPQNLVAVRSNAQVTLTWSKNSETNIVRYMIYGGTSANPTSKIDSTAVGSSDTTKVISGLTNETKYYFRITAMNVYGLASGYSNEINSTPSATGVEEKNNLLPEVYSLSQNYPNPFNPSTTFSFGLPVPSEVSLKVFDILGREVATLVNARLDAGYHYYNWNASALSSGVYIYRINARSSDKSENKSFVEVKKLLLQK